MDGGDCQGLLAWRANLRAVARGQVMAMGYANTMQTGETDSEHRAQILEDVLNQPFHWPLGQTKPLAA